MGTLGILALLALVALLFAVLVVPVRAVVVSSAVCLPFAFVPPVQQCTIETRSIPRSRPRVAACERVRLAAATGCDSEPAVAK